MATTTPQRSMDDDPTKSPQQDTGTKKEDNNNNGSEVVHDETRSPDEALDEIKKQQTHNLYCPNCKRNITTDAEIFVKGQETDPYKTDYFRLCVPLVIPFKFPTFPLSRFSLAEPWKKLKELSPNCLPRLSPTYLRFLLAAVLLLLSVIVLWSSHFPLPLPESPFHLPSRGSHSPSPLPGSPSLSPVPTSHSPSPGSHSPLPRPEPPSPSPSPGPGSPLTVPGTTSPLPLSGTPSTHPKPGPYSPLPLSGTSSPHPQPGPDPYEKIRWLIHFPSIKYLSVISLLFLAILALLWSSIFPIINYLIVATKRWSVRGITRPSTNVTNPPTPTSKGTDQAPEKGPGGEESKEGVVGQKNDIPDNGNPVDGLGTNTEILPARKPVRLVLWNNVVVPVLNLFPMELDILKSIVFGGLIESITSLNVVSSAAGSGASTLNVIALGVANLFSGLFLIIHSLYGLITFQPPSHSSSKEHNITYLKDRALYVDRLGNYKKVKLHCFVVVVSFIFFAVIPPLFYGLSVKRTDNGHYQAAVVLAASLVCVISLSFAKAYAFKMEKKLRTVAEYTGMAIGASALSFITSQLLSDLLEKYGFHDTE